MSILAAWLWAGAARAQLPEPACQPAPRGTGTPARHGETPEGEWHAWYCPGRVGWTLEVIYKRRGWRLVHPDPETLEGKSLAEIFSLYWQLNARTPPDHPSVRGLMEAARRDAEAHPPPERVWVVPGPEIGALMPTYFYSRKEWRPCAPEGGLCVPPQLPAIVAYGERAAGRWSEHLRIEAPQRCTADAFERAPTGPEAKLCIHFVPGARNRAPAAERVPAGERCDVQEYFLEDGAVYAKVAPERVALCVERLPAAVSSRP